MPYFMSQRVFDLAALTLAWGQTMHFGGGGEQQKKAILSEGVQTYRRMYPEDDFEPELIKAAEMAAGWITDLTPDYRTQLQWATSLMMAPKDYRPDGKRWPWRPFPFKGRWFAAPRRQPPERYNQFVKNLGLYYLHIQTGKIPVQDIAMQGGAHTIKRVHG